VVLFGEAISTTAILASRDAAMEADVMLVCGTSAEVSPAAELPLLTHARGGVIVEINIAATQLSPLCQVTIHASTSVVLPRLAEAVQSRRST
jgi:NAD-dependent deacetylase